MRPARPCFPAQGPPRRLPSTGSHAQAPPPRSAPPSFPHFAAPQASNFFPIDLCHSAPGRSAPSPQRPGQQKLRHSAGQQLRYGAPASNKPHLAEKSTPVWLAIWRTWAGFANSQLLRATFCSIYLYRCAHSHCWHVGLLLRQTQICRPICTDCLRHLRISAG